MNRTSRIVLTGFVCVLAVAQPAFAQVFFSMDYSGSPAGGWDGVVPTAPTHTRSFVAGAGPRGENVYELAQLRAPSLQGAGGQFYWGWGGTLEASDPAPGSSRFYRFRMRFTPNTNFRGLYWESPYGRIYTTNKLLIIADGCGDDCRPILNYRAQGDGTFRYSISKDGGVDPAWTPTYNVSTGWFNVQLEVKTSNPPGANNGYYKLWVNNDAYAAPTAQALNIVINNRLHRTVKFGAYNNDGLASDGVHTFWQTGFQAATAFDANWARGGGTSGSTMPSAPTNLRIISPN